MSQGNDQVFQLSLTEIAFTISFILLLLLGYLVYREQSERLAAQEALAKVQKVEKAIETLNDAKAALAVGLAGAGASNPEDVITKLVAVEDVRAERDQLKQQVQDLDAKLTALGELRERLTKTAQADHPQATREEVESALALKDQIIKELNAVDHESKSPTQPALPGSSLSPVGQPQRPASASLVPVRDLQVKDPLGRVKQAIATTNEFKRGLKSELNREMKPGNEVQTVKEVVAAAKSFGELSKSSQSPELIKKENSDLRGQVAFLKNRLDARGGRDFPPCWADQNGKVEFLFSIETKPNAISVAPGWPQAREADARALPDIDAVLAASPYSIEEFLKRVQGIFNWSKRHDPECRHYVYLKSSIPDAVQSDRVRLQVEGVFYKLEMIR